MSAHAYLAPSSAHVRQQCAASAALMHQYPQEETEASREGTAAHWVAYDLVVNGGRGVAPGVIAPNGVMVSDEMIEASELYFSDMLKRVPDLQGLYLEQPISIPSLGPHSWGTPDAWHVSYQSTAYAGKPRLLTLWDYKYGHRYVPAFENWQAIEYVAGILEFLQVDGFDDQTLWVDIRIVQPRCYVGGSSVRNWLVRAADLRAYFNLAAGFEEAALSPDAKATTGPACRDCRAGHCVAAQAAAYNGIDVSMQPKPFDLSPAALSLELRKLSRAYEAIAARKDELEEQALSHIRQGTAVPGYFAATSHGRERWAVPDAEVIALGEVLKVDLFKPKPITPNQARKAGVPTALVDSMAEVPSTGLKLKEVDTEQLQKVFAPIDGGGQ